MWCAFYMGKMKTKCIRKLSIRRKGWNLPHLAASLRLDQGGNFYSRYLCQLYNTYIYSWAIQRGHHEWCIFTRKSKSDEKIKEIPGEKTFSGKYQPFMGIMNDSKRKVKNNVSKQNMFVSHLKRILYIYLFILYTVWK